MASRSLDESLLGHIAMVNDLITARLEAPMRQAGLNFGTFQLLSAVRGGKEQLSQIELAKRLGITAPSLCEAVQAAATKGLVQQLPSETDRRVKRVALTEKGRDAVQQVLDAFARLDHSIAEQISDRDIANGLKLLKKVAEKLD
jgi:DNA-binding MarR family transcriptional regulator